MTERDEARRARRLAQVIDRLQKGRRPRITAEDAHDARAIRAASRLVGARLPYPRMDPAFRRRLAARLEQSAAARPTRRWALAAAAGIVGGAALGVAGDRVAQEAASATAGSKSWAQERIVPERAGATWVDTGVTLTELTDGTPKAITAGGLSLFLVRQGEGVRALSAVCTHKPCQLFWDAEYKAVQCPWGKYQTFSLDGTSKSGNLPPLPVADVRVQDGRVEIYGVS